jgi:putative ABC transport system permease protein
MLRLAFATVWHDRRRYIPIAIVITVAGLLIMAQIAVANGVFRDAAAPVSRSHAQLWVGPKGASTLLESTGLDATRASALWTVPELVRLEPYWSQYGELSARPRTDTIPGEEKDGAPLRSTIAIYLETAPDAALYAQHLPAEMRKELAELETIVIGREDANVLGVDEGDRVWFNNRPMRIVGTLPGLQGLGFSTVLIGSVNAPAKDTPAFWLMSLTPDISPARIEDIARELTLNGGLSVLPAHELIDATINEFMMESGAGTIFLFSSGFALAVAAMVVSQVIRAAVMAALREYAALRAFGIGFGRIAMLVLTQGAIIAAVSVVVMTGATLGLLALFRWGAVSYDLPLWLASSVVGSMCLLLAVSVLLAIRYLRRADPASLLR